MNLSNGLLGLGGFGAMGGSTPQLTGLLGQYYNPAELKNQKLKQGLLNFGLAMLSQQPRVGAPISLGESLGAGLRGAAEGVKQAQDDYMQNAMMGYTMDRQAKDDAWQQKTRERQQNAWDDEDQAKKAQKAFLSALPEDQRKLAAAYPDQFGKLYAEAQLKTSFPGVFAEKAPAAVQEYEYAIAQLRQRGVPEDKLPTFQEFSKPKSRGIVFTNPDGTTVQIGGSADTGGNLDGTSLPAELGARIGLGQNFLQKDVPEISGPVAAGDATGPLDYAWGAMGYGTSGQVQRRMASGVDALRRNLTGAGMSQGEANDYANRYLPTWKDTAETLSLKLQSLEADLQAVASGAIKGKAGKVSDLLPGAKVQTSPLDSPLDLQGMSDEELKAIINGQ